VITGLMDQIVALELELVPYRVSRSAERVAELVLENRKLSRRVAHLEERSAHYKGLLDDRSRHVVRLRGEVKWLRGRVEDI
jgi:hypothetical protein